jgi:hypothetical protein
VPVPRVLVERVLTSRMMTRMMTRMMPSPKRLTRQQRRLVLVVLPLQLLMMMMMMLIKMIMLPLRRRGRRRGWTIPRQLPRASPLLKRLRPPKLPWMPPKPR